MGKAVLEPPRGMQGAKPGAAIANADDLLAQLAGEEIDRMLAEADLIAAPPSPSTPVEPTLLDHPHAVPASGAVAPVLPRTPPPAPPASTTTPPNAPAAPSPSPATLDQPLADAPARFAVTGQEPSPSPAEELNLGQELDQLLTRLEERPRPAGSTQSLPELSPDEAALLADETVAAVDTKVTAQTPLPSVDELVEQLKQSPADPSAEAVPATVPDPGAPQTGAPHAASHAGPSNPSAAVAIPSPAPVAAAAVAEPDATSPQERVALDLDEDQDAIRAIASLTDEDDTSPDSQPLYVRVLEFLNAPLAACSDSTRELIGKLAILTTCNAVAVLIYIFLFRRH